MARITWDGTGQRQYETGVDHGVLYLTDKQNDDDKPYNKPHAWNGLTTVTESPSGAEPTALYADNIKYLNLTSVEEFGGTIEAYTYPDAFALCDGTYRMPGKGDQMFGGMNVGQQRRQSFGLAYRTRMGNDEEYEDHGYKLHLIYGAQAAPSEKAYATINDSPEAITFSWTLTTTPIAFDAESKYKDLRPTALITLESPNLPKAFMDAVEEALYGTADKEGHLPLPSELTEMYDNLVLGNGSTVSGETSRGGGATETGNGKPKPGETLF